MNIDLLNKMLNALSYSTFKAISNVAKYPTERNGCYIVGYIAALHENGLLTDDEYHYWIAATGQITSSEALRKEILNRRKS